MTRAFILYITWKLNGGPEKLYRDDPRAEFEGPTGANPGLVAMATHMLRLQLTQDKSWPTGFSQLSERPWNSFKNPSDIDQRREAADRPGSTGERR